MLYPIINISMHASYDIMYKLLDKGVLEYIGPFGIVKSINNMFFNVNNLKTAMIYHYSGYILIAIISILHILCV